MDNFIPNANPSLVVLQVWAARGEGLEDVGEFPIIAWRIAEGESPIPISTDGEPERDDARDWMVFDRAANRGAIGGEDIHSRERCIETLQADIGIRRHKKGLR